MLTVHARAGIYRYTKIATGGDFGSDTTHGTRNSGGGIPHAVCLYRDVVMCRWWRS